MDQPTETPTPAATITPAPADGLPPDTPWYARIFIADWRNAHRWWSIRIPLLFGALCEFYAEYKDQINAWLLAHIPEQYRPHAAAAAFILIAFVRLLKQKPKEIQP